jgi:phosphoglucosamine mutase
VVASSKTPASDVLRPFEPKPQLLKNVRAQSDVLSKDAVKKEIAAAEAKLKGRGRLLIRESGTEPLVRVMAEGADEALIGEVVDGVIAAISDAAAET